MAKAKTTQVFLVLDKETKNTFRYTEDSDIATVGSIYLSKPVANKMGNPESITVTIANGD
jgi:hypothetical protein